MANQPNCLALCKSTVHQLFIDDEGYDTYWYNREIGAGGNVKLGFFSQDNSTNSDLGI